MNKTIRLFTDSSVNPQSKIGFASYLKIEDLNKDLKILKDRVKTKKFENSSSTKLELQTLLWALDEIFYENKEIDFSIEIYTDCQNIISLSNREDRLKTNNYYSLNGKLIKNHDLYKEFFDKKERLNLTFIKVKGHKKKSLKDEIDDIFNLVDKASRNALREYLNTHS